MAEVVEVVKQASSVQVVTDGQRVAVAEKNAVTAEQVIETQKVVQVPSNGPVVINQNGTGGTSFLQTPDLIEDTDAVYFYMGWLDLSGAWMVRRQIRVDASTTDATPAENSSYANLSAAWAEKETLNYI